MCLHFGSDNTRHLKHTVHLVLFLWLIDSWNHFKKKYSLLLFFFCFIPSYFAVASLKVVVIYFTHYAFWTANVCTAAGIKCFLVLNNDTLFFSFCQALMVDLGTDRFIRQVSLWTEKTDNKVRLYNLSWTEQFPFISLVSSRCPQFEPVMNFISLSNMGKKCRKNKQTSS